MKRIVFIAVFIVVSIQLLAQSGIYFRGGASPQNANYGAELRARVDNQLPGAVGYNIGFAKLKAPFSEESKTVISFGWSRYFDIMKPSNTLYLQWYGALTAASNWAVHQERSSFSGTSKPEWTGHYSMIAGLRFSYSFLDLRTGIGYGYDKFFDWRIVPDLTLGIRLWNPKNKNEKNLK